MIGYGYMVVNGDDNDDKRRINTKDYDKIIMSVASEKSVEAKEVPEGDELAEAKEEPEGDELAEAKEVPEGEELAEAKEVPEGEELAEAKDIPETGEPGNIQ